MRIESKVVGGKFSSKRAARSGQAYRKFIPDARPASTMSAGRGSFWYKIWSHARSRLS